jgi:hypothetical protein
MKKTFLVLIVMLALYCSVSVVFAQSVNAETISPISQVQSLRDQIDLSNKINDKILNTIYWTLGILITVFLAIIGLNFFQNFFLNYKKLNAIKDDIYNYLKNELSIFRDQNKKTLDSYNVAIESKIKSEMLILSDSFKLELQQLRDSYEDIYRENLIRKAFEYAEKNQMGYILNLIDLLELDIKKQWDFRIHESLDLISRCLDDNGYKKADGLTRLQRALDKLPNEYLIIKKKIEAKMSS